MSMNVKDDERVVEDGESRRKGLFTAAQKSNDSIRYGNAMLYW